MEERKINNKRKSKTFFDDKLKTEIAKRSVEVAPDSEFLNIMIELFSSEEKDASKNKRYYFKIEMLVLIFSSLSGLLSAFAVVGIWSEIGEIVMGMLSAAISAASACLIGIKGLCQYRETWLRHRKCVNEFLEECRLYAGYLGEYEAYRDDPNLETAENRKKKQIHEEDKWFMFKTKLVKIQSQSNQEFISNMNKKEK